MKIENINFVLKNGELRKVRILLPDRYKTSGKSYPVLYMFDGQNLFDKNDSYVGVTWGVKEELKKLYKNSTSKEFIVVGIDNAEDFRLNEYSIFDFNYNGVFIKAHGINYIEEVVNNLVPLIDKKYKTIPVLSERYIAGSSLGGLMAAYTIIKYPNVFSKAGIFSLASWISEEKFLEFTKTSEIPVTSHFYIMVGANEEIDYKTKRVNVEGSKMYIESSVNFLKALVEKGVKASNFELVVDPIGIHNEKTWRRNLPQFIEFLNK